MQKENDPHLFDHTMCRSVLYVVRHQSVVFVPQKLSLSIDRYRFCSDIEHCFTHVVASTFVRTHRRCN